jgi:hypothetical protein
MAGQLARLDLIRIPPGMLPFGSINEWPLVKMSGSTARKLFPPEK